MNKPEISVIMAVYNTEKYLAEAIESILNQTFKIFELIIINDKSTDSSLEIINGYMKRDKRIVLINNKRNSGPAESRNNGLKIAKGKYIAIFDSDDIALSKKLEIQYNFLEENTDIFLLGTSWTNVNEKGVKISTRKHKFNSRKINKNLPYKSMIHQPTVMFRNEGGIKYREKFRNAEDRDLWLRFLSKNKKMRVIPDVLLNYRININSLSNKNSFEQMFFRDKAVKFYFQRLKYGYDDYARFNPKEELKNFNPRVIIGGNLKASMIVSFRETMNAKIFRRELINFWKEYGYLSWRISIIYYIISFMPKFIRIICINIRDKILS